MNDLSKAREPERDAAGPFVPPLSVPELPGTGGRIGADPEDFTVDEVPLYAPSGSGEHWYVRIRKRAATTPAAVEAVARAAGVPDREIGCAGMKDKHAVTTQWLSVPARGTAPPSSWALPEPFEVVEVSRHTNKLRTGHLLGNRFRIRLVDVEPNALARARALMDHLARDGLLNVFGAQRFGQEGKNLARALQWLRSPGGRARPFDQKLYSSVVQAEVFNRYAAARAALPLTRLLDGEVVRLEGSSAVFVVDVPEKEEPRLLTGDIHLTGPIYGPKMKQAARAAAELEAAAVEALGLDGAALSRLGRAAPGTRRDLLVRPGQVGVQEDRGALVLEFSLPAGSYATEVLRQLTRSGFLEGSRS